MLSLTSDQIFQKKNPGDLFENDLDLVKSSYRQLSLKWHPDKPGGDKDTFHHITSLYKAALNQISEGNWSTSNILYLTSKDGAKYRIRFLREYSFELGTTYISDTTLIHRLPAEHKELFSNAVAQIHHLRYPNDKVKELTSRCMPQISLVFETKDGEWIMVLKKTPDVFNLRDVLNYLARKMDGKHAAWCISRLCNLVCALNYSDLTHNAFNLDNCYVSPDHHSILLLGGWWYAAQLGTRLKKVPAVTYPLIPNKVLTTKLATSSIDLELIRWMGRELLGDSTGSRLRTDKTIPRHIVEWLQCASNGDPKKDFDNWSTMLDKAYGPRKFIELKITKEDIYGV